MIKRHAHDPLPSSPVSCETMRRRATVDRGLGCATRIGRIHRVTYLSSKNDSKRKSNHAQGTHQAYTRHLATVSRVVSNRSVQVPSHSKHTTKGFTTMLTPKRSRRLRESSPHQPSATSRRTFLTLLSDEPSQRALILFAQTAVEYFKAEHVPCLLDHVAVASTPPRGLRTVTLPSFAC